MSQPTFSPASILADTIVRTVELGVTITDAAIDGETTVVWCELRANSPDRCPGCGTVGTYRDRVERRLTDLPVAGHPLQLRVRVPRYRCPAASCERVIFARDISPLAKAGTTTTRRCARYVLRQLIVDRATVAAVGRELGRSWDTVNSIARPPAGCWPVWARLVWTGCGSSGWMSTAGRTPVTPPARGS